MIHKDRLTLFKNEKEENRGCSIDFTITQICEPALLSHSNLVRRSGLMDFGRNLKTKLVFSHNYFVFAKVFENFEN